MKDSETRLGWKATGTSTVTRQCRQQHGSSSPLSTLVADAQYGKGQLPGRSSELLGRGRSVWFEVHALSCWVSLHACC
jgi:hypothetical protein